MAMDKTAASLCKLSTALIAEIPDGQWSMLEFRVALQWFAPHFHYALTITPTLRDDASDLLESIRYARIYEDACIQIDAALQSQYHAVLAMSNAFWHLIFAIMGAPRVAIQEIPEPRDQARLTKYEQVIGKHRLDELVCRLACILKPEQSDAETYLAIKKLRLVLTPGLLVAKAHGWKSETMRKHLGTVFAHVYVFALEGHELSVPASEDLVRSKPGVEFLQVVFQIVENPNFDLAASAIKVAMQNAMGQVKV